jgi:hypothetical protein
MLCDLGLEHMEVRFNQEELFIEDPITGKISKIFCYPSNSKIDYANTFILLTKHTHHLHLSIAHRVLCLLLIILVGNHQCEEEYIM